MRVVALEEHVVHADIIGGIPAAALTKAGWPPAVDHLFDPRIDRLLGDVGDARVHDMDEAGLTVQILSATGPGAELMPPAAARDMARRYNDRLREAVLARPDRYAAFAHLPMSDPEGAAEELRRAVRALGMVGAMVNGTTGGRFLDGRRFEPLLAEAEALDVPLYLHPGPPPEPVRAAYYADLPGRSGMLLATAGWGWHSETALHVLRLVVSGTLERHPRLKIVVGHMGEGLATMLTRCDDVLGRVMPAVSARSVSQTIHDQLWVTTSGFFSFPPFAAALSAFGADRLLFSVDYPFSDNHRAMRFLADLPVSPHDRNKIAHGNADALFSLPH